MLKFVVVMMVAMMPVSAFAMAERQPKQDPMIGTVAPEFVLDTIYNGTKKLSEARAGKKAVLFFWATWCPHCHEQITRLNNSVESLKRRGYSVILVDLGESIGQVKAFLQFNTIFLDSFVDPDNSLQDLYQIQGVPTIFYLDEKGVVVSVDHEFGGNVDSIYNVERKN